MDDADDSYMKFETVFSKDPEEPNVLDVIVTLREYSQSGDDRGPPLAMLEGFLVRPGYLPEKGDKWYFDVFDMRSAHTAEAFGILTGEMKLLAKAVGTGVDLDDFDSVLHMERAWVDPSLRGRNLALRMMREAQQVFGRFGLLTILKAHPDGDDVPDADCLKLAAYYQSDKQLALVPISKRKYPGWLVAVWDEPIVHPDDSPFFSGDCT